MTSKFNWQIGQKYKTREGEFVWVTGILPNTEYPIRVSLAEEDMADNECYTRNGDYWNDGTISQYDIAELCEDADVPIKDTKGAPKMAANIGEEMPFTKALAEMQADDNARFTRAEGWACSHACLKCLSRVLWISFDHERTWQPWKPYVDDLTAAYRKVAGGCSLFLNPENNEAFPSEGQHEKDCPAPCCGDVYLHIVYKDGLQFFSEAISFEDSEMLCKEFFDENNRDFVSIPYVSGGGCIINLTFVKVLEVLPVGSR